MISTFYLRRTGDDPEAEILLNRFRNEGFTQLKKINIERVIRLEGLHQEESGALIPLFCHPVVESISVQSTLKDKEGPVYEVGYQRAVTDPEWPSIKRGADAVGLTHLKWARIAHRYQFIGISKENANALVNRHLFNQQVQTLIHLEKPWSTLKPRGESGPVEKISLKGLNTKALLKLSENRRLFLNEVQMKALQEIESDMGRPFYDAELEMFAQTWSDHCFHTTWKSLGLLKALQDATHAINHPLVLSSFEDNAGVMALYDGWALTLKGETHNSPSAVSPYGGIMTKHGGVIRDTLGCGQGAWPIGGSTVMGIGDPEIEWQDVPKGALHPKTILFESIRGTADYCNPMGIPMMFPVYKIHPGYVGKCFALGHSIGLIPESRAPKGTPRPGDLAILIGGKTGRDGLHGATVSSDSMTHDTAEVDAAHVQIGHPIEERKFMEAIPELRDRDCLHAITDLGAAGLSSAAGEMGSESGIWINLAKVPLKTRGMHPWEIWISESQERMLLCTPPEKLEETLNILERYEVLSAVIGKFTDTNQCQVVCDPDIDPVKDTIPSLTDMQGEVVVDLSFKDLRKGCPLPEFDLTEPEPAEETKLPPALKSEAEIQTAVENVLSHLNICDQSPAGAQYDNTIQGNTVIGPYATNSSNMPNDIWVSAPVRGKPCGAVTSNAFNPLYGDVNPVKMAELMMIEAISKQVAAGVRLEDITLCDNFYTPRVTPQMAYILKGMVTACCNLSIKLGTPFISGKDSSSGTFISEDDQRIDIPPTLCVMAMGRVPDVQKLIPKPWQKPESALLLAGPVTTEMGGSIYLNTCKLTGHRLPDPDVDVLMRFWDNLKTLQNGTILSAATLGEGGLIKKVFDMALGSGMGCELNLDTLMQKMKTERVEAALFSEMIGAMVLEVPASDSNSVCDVLNAIPIGTVNSTTQISIRHNEKRIDLEMQALTHKWKQPFQELLFS